MTRTVPCRLPASGQSLVDHGRVLRFSFQGRRYDALAGDTVASALVANGVDIVSRSFKYHRPRGIMSMTGCDANTLVTVNGAPNIPAEYHVLADGDKIGAQNYSGSLGFDTMAWTGFASRFLPVGFYYRAFFRPKGAWRLWEPMIRRMAGLGRIDTNAAHGAYDKMHLFADVAVIGGGPAGLAAAAEAAGKGQRVVLVDRNAPLGGALNYARLTSDRAEVLRRRDELVARIGAANVTVLAGAQCEGIFGDNWLSIVKGHRLYKLRAGKVVVATGADEQIATFTNNDCPGIMLASAAQKLMRLYDVRPGRRAVVLAANDFGYGVALDLAECGVEVAAIVDTRETSVGPLANAAAELSLRIIHHSTIVKARGRRRLRGVKIAAIARSGSATGSDEQIECDLLCIAAGFSPDLALAGQAGARLVYDEASAMQRVQDLPDGISVAGAANQQFALEAAIADGRRAARGEISPPDETALALTDAFPYFSDGSGKAFVDFDEDLTAADITDSVASGFSDIQLLKRYTTATMGPSQGRHSAIPVIRLAARARGESPSAIGTTTARPPYSGESFGVLAGRDSEPVRHTAMHHRHIEAGAQMIPTALWLRPGYYAQPAYAEAAIAAEAEAVRTKAGLIDVSTLGKIEIRGPDAAEFLNRLYFTGHLKQPKDRARYALMTDLTGTIIDDGVVCRLDDQHFFVTATSSGVEAVIRTMYLWNARWRIDVDISNVTSAYAAVNLAGPRSRQILGALCRDVDLSTQAFPYMAVRCGHVADVPARIMRVGFVGELGFEIHVPSGCGEYVWDQLIEAGASHGLRPFGVEAQRLLRLEKGHIIIAQDTDGLTNLLEIGMAAEKPAKPFFIGGAALEAHRRRGISRKLVGFTLDAAAPLPKECHLVIDGDDIAGRVTSCARSAAVGRIIGLAYVRPRQAEAGRKFSIRIDGGKMVEATVAALPFYDPGNERQKT